MVIFAMKKSYFFLQQGQCAYSDQVARKGCSSAEVFKFHCPQTRESNKHEHPRYADPNGKYVVFP